MIAVGESSGGVRVTGLMQPRQLIVSLYGLYARQNNGWLSVAAVMRLMAELGVDEQAVRSSISRLERRGLLIAERSAGAAGYKLSPLAHQILAVGDARIFGRRRAALADGWLLVVFSVPESQQDKRYQLRLQLSRLGFGTVAPGVWVAPGHLASEANEVVDRLGLAGHAKVFRAQHVGFDEQRDNVSRWWDLDTLRQLYAAFLDRYRPVRERWSGQSEIENSKAFAEYVELVTAWRRLAYADPGLPLELLPADWNGVEAEELFADLRALVAGPASMYVSATLVSAKRG